jgi:hypothetical protein
VEIVDIEPTPLQDTPEFKKYTERLLKLVTARPGIKLAEIDPLLQPPRRGTWTQCALEWQFDKIRSETKGGVTRLFPYELRQTPNLTATRSKYHLGLFCKTPPKKQAYFESIYGENI